MFVLFEIVNEAIHTANVYNRLLARDYSRYFSSFFSSVDTAFSQKNVGKQCVRLNHPITYFNCVDERVARIALLLNYARASTICVSKQRCMGKFFEANHCRWAYLVGSVSLSSHVRKAEVRTMPTEWSECNAFGLGLSRMHFISAINKINSILMAIQ